MKNDSLIRLTKTGSPDDVSVHLIKDRKDLRDISGIENLRAKIAERVEEEELVFSVPSEHGLTIIVKPKKEDQLSYRLQSARMLGAKVRKILNSEQVKEATFVSNWDEKDNALAVIEGIVLANYQFLNYKTGDSNKPNSLKKLNVFSSGISVRDLDELHAVAAGTFAARDFVNEPVITLTASEWSKRMGKLGKIAGFTVKVLDRKKIEELKMGGLLGVNKGSVEPPTFNILEWKPKNAKNERPIILVGKGVVYDTGGYSIKGGPHMATMKCDMGGGAAVVGALSSISMNRLPVHVIGLIPATDNRIDGKALVPDDVITMMSGLTVEVLNTDAEGRLVLADALHYAKQYDPELVIDLATLTGAAARITDFHGIAMCSDRTDRTDSLKESGERVYERIMEFPMWNEFHEAIKSNVADIKNLGGVSGGNITAATFLHRFTDYPWVHLDIAGPAFMEKDVDYRLKGGTGAGVRLLYDFIKHTYA